ncbi:MAG: OmpA family protein [Sulfuriferula multivorans]|uniref:OmpA family protein n=1 Tax=Sulfuriferula multivorans TaxID=1559896 RepID=A0A7C9P564_9PROT|nr:OmpA family protein [Sulfuriferula multivorans]
MRTTPLFLSILTATLISAGAVSAQAAEGKFYDPSNAASPTGFTTNYEAFRTVGCPGQGLLNTPCKVPKEADTDGDGVVDSKDKCPNTPAGRKVNADGCELDRDGDGIVDGDDKCPDVYAKTADGCPLPVAKPVEAKPADYSASPTTPAAIPRRLVLEGVNFNYDKSTLRPEDIAIIDQNAADLKEWGNIDVEVSGHTDSRGSDKYNMGLSLRRADAVRDYLITKGISADRLTAKGYGESQPLESNDTDEGRFKNRRVELNQIQK